MYAKKFTGKRKACGKIFTNRAGTEYCSVVCYHRDYYRPKVKKTCKACGKVFETRMAERKNTCDDRCANKWSREKFKEKRAQEQHERYAKNHPKVKIVKICVVCERTFTAKKKYQKYCGNSCRVKSYRKQPRVKLLRRHDAQKRHAQKNYTIGALMPKEWKDTKKYFSNRCAYCEKESIKLQQDHFIPVKLGGHYVKQNIVPACPSCNHSKNKKHPRIWLIQKFENGEDIYKRIEKYLKSLPPTQLHLESAHRRASPVDNWRL